MSNENNKMSPEHKFRITFLIIVVLGVLGLVAIIAGGICLNNHIAMENGYERIVMPGSTCAQWQKTKTER